jgi:hypothetical protein
MSLDTRDFSDWMDWIGAAKMHGPGLAPDAIAEIGKRTRKRPAVEAIRSWTEDTWSIGRSVYDDVIETWRFGVLQFSQNYGEFLEFLPPLRAIDRFKDRPGADILLVYNFIWRPQTYTVLFEIREGSSVIVGSPGRGTPFPADHAEEAGEFLNAMIPNQD